jgi:chromosome segregation protein
LPLEAIPRGDEDDEAMQTLRNNLRVQVSLLSRVKQPNASEPTPEHPGLVALAEQLVSCEHPELTDLPTQLLGRTLIVRDLATARAITAHAPGFRLVTLQGELLEPDGTLTVGTHHAETGILSRKSELRELREQLAHLDVRLHETDLDCQALRDKLHRAEAGSQELQDALTVLTEQEADLRSRVQRHQDRRQGLHEEVTLSRDEILRIEQDVQTLEAAWRAHESQAAEAESLVQALHERMRHADEEIRTREVERQQAQQAFTQAQVTFAQGEERRRGLLTQHQQASRDYQQRSHELLQNQQNLANLRARLQESQQAMLNASVVLAHAYLVKEESQRQIAEWRTHQESVHQRELEASNLRHQRETLVQRLRDDYQIEVAELIRQAASESLPANAPEEIDELRRKLSRLGNVNMEALAELQELERRATELQSQFDDLTTAKKSLEEIIGKINVDSKRLFMDTFSVIRTHFQELFRKLFGGGMADIVLEDETDVLESGIDIIARPPGKELRSITLMSGGEKTMTAVALLLAVFRSKPSPFCLLDEVDAALDEANIGRFTSVLREFSELSQFIVVTHSKKTMAAADTLYGITMQESGISKQVTIRFDDWVEENLDEKAQAS